MKRKTSTLPTRVFKFGLPFGATENADIVREQMRLAHRYQNDLVHTLRASRAAYRLEVAKIGDIESIDAVIAETVAAMTPALDELKLLKQQRDKSAVAAAELALAPQRTRLRELRSKRKAVAADIANSQEFKAAVAAINERQHAMALSLRAACGVYWGTYLLTEASVEQQRRGKYDPKFQRWDGCGRVGVQIQKGMTTTQLFSCADTRIRCQREPGSKFATLWLRVQSQDNGVPVFAKFPMVLHRPLPEDAAIKNVYVRCQRIGTRYRYEAAFVIESATFVVPKRRRNRVVALNFGWRQQQDGIRIGMAVDSSGRKHRITLPQELVSAFEHANSLTSIRDRELNGIKAALTAAVVENAPEWYCHRIRTLASIHKPDRLVDFLRYWRDHRFAGDDHVYALADAWRRQERHLHQWEDSERTRALGRRQHVYRNIAAEYARKYDVIVLPDADFAELAVPDSGAAVVAGTRRFQTAPGELRSAFAAACSRHGATEVVSDCAFTTRRCCKCNHVNTGDFSRSVVYTCESCGREYDQDVNACENTLNAYYRMEAAAE